VSSRHPWPVRAAAVFGAVLAAVLALPFILAAAVLALAAGLLFGLWTFGRLAVTAALDGFWWLRQRARLHRNRPHRRGAPPDCARLSRRHRKAWEAIKERNVELAARGALIEDEERRYQP
jgi:membrane protease YdiL (CAAX protease family)